MKTTCSALLIVSAFAFLSAAGAARAFAHPAGTVANRGAMAVKGRTVKAVTMGPEKLHGYSGVPGGAIFVVDAVTGTDADCAAALAKGANLLATPLIADRVAQVSVGAGQVACLATDTQRSFELLWHTFAIDSSETIVASARTR
jgi:hypothetical protein